jgi:hypothetical protein
LEQVSAQKKIALTAGFTQKKVYLEDGTCMYSGWEYLLVARLTTAILDCEKIQNKSQARDEMKKTCRSSVEI